MQIDWKGVMPAVTTKFTSDDNLDLTMFEVNIRAQMNAGVHGIILGGTLGEASTLSSTEREVLCKETVRIVNGTIPVIMNIAEQTTQKAIKAAIDAKKNGINGLMLLPPMRYKADERETITYFKKVANAINLPIMIYNNPIDYGIEVTIAMFQELVTSCSNIEAVKESTRDISNITRLKNKFGKRLAILSGVDTLALESLVLGADGWVAGLVCAFPKETVAIYNLIKNGNIKKALDIYRWFLPLLELDINTKLVQNIKLAEVATGIGTEHVREPRLPLIGEERAKVLQIIEKGIINRPSLEEVE